MSSDEIAKLEKEMEKLDKKADSYQNDIKVLRQILKHLQEQFEEFKKK